MADSDGIIQAPGFSHSDRHKCARLALQDALSNAIKTSPVSCISLRSMLCSKVPVD